MEEKQKLDAIQLSAEGKSQRDIAEAIGVSQSTVARLQAKHREDIQKETERLIEALPKIIDQTKRDIGTTDILSKYYAGEVTLKELPKSLQSLVKEDSALISKFLDLSYKKQADVMKALGVYPAVAPSVFIQNLFQAGSKAIISPYVLTFIQKYAHDNLLEEEEKIIEVTNENKDIR